MAVSGGGIAGLVLIIIGVAVTAGLMGGVINSHRSYPSVVCDPTSGFANCSSSFAYPCNPVTTPSRQCKGWDNCNPTTAVASGICGNGTCAFNSTYRGGYFACSCKVYNYPDKNGLNCKYKYP